MKFDCKFHSLDYSQSLVEFTEKRFKKLKKFELKPIDVHVTFSAERRDRLVDVYIKGLEVPYRATASSDEFKTAVDLVLQKITRQMEKEKSKIQNHKSPEMSAEGRLQHVSEFEGDEIDEDDEVFHSV